MSGPDKVRGRVIRGDVQAESELSGAIAQVWKSFLVGVLAGVTLTLTLAALFHPGGLWAYLRLWQGWFSYSVLPDFMGIRSTPEARLWMRHWEGTKIIRLMSGCFFAISGSAAGLLTWRYMKARGEAGAEGLGLREGEHRLLSPEALKKEIDRRVRLYEKSPLNAKAADYKYTPHDIEVSTSKIPVVDKILSTSTGVAGVPGTGKTTAINEYLEQILKAGDKAMVVDINGEFYSRFGRPGDVILSLTDRRAAAWDFWAEGLDELVLAAGLVEYREDMSEEAKFFQGNGRNLLAALLRNSRSLPELWQLTMRSLDETKDFLLDRQDPVKPMFEGRDARQLTTIFTISTSGLQAFLPYLGHHAEERARESGRPEAPFSIRKWVLDDEDKRSVFLVARDQDWEMSRPFFRLASHITGLSIVERDPGADRKIWYVCDEMSTVGFVPSIPVILDRARKYSGRAIIGFQTYSQLESIFGPTLAMSILSGFGSLFVFRISDDELARRFSARFTSREVELSRVSQSMSGTGGPSINTDIQERPLVSASQLMTLPERTAFVRLSGFPPSRLVWEVKRYQVKNPDARAMAEKPSRPWIGSMPVSRYGKLRDQERAEFLNELKASVSECLRIFHDKGQADRQALLKAAVDRCAEVLGESSVVRETIDHESYELALAKGKKTRTITVMRGSTTVVLTVKEQENGTSVEASASGRPAPDDDGILIPNDEDME